MSGQLTLTGGKRVLFARPWYEMPENQRRLASWSKTLLHGKYDRALDITFNLGIPTGQCLQAVDRKTGQVVHRAVIINPNPTYVDRNGVTQPMFTTPTDQYRGSQTLIAHEQGHAGRTTRHNAEPGTALNDVLNMLEDERMERDMVKLGVPVSWLFHGRKGVFIGLGRRCWQIWREDTDHARRNAQLADGDFVPALLSAVLYARWGLRYGDREMFYHDAFDDNAAAIARWENDVFPLVAPAWEAESTARAEDYAHQILAVLGIPEQTSNGRLPENPFGACPEGRTAPREARVTLRQATKSAPKPGQTRPTGKPKPGDPASKPEPHNGSPEPANGSETAEPQETEGGKQTAGQSSDDKSGKPQGKAGKAGRKPKDGEQPGDQSSQQPGDQSGEGAGDDDQAGDKSKGGSKSSQQSGDQSDKSSNGSQSGQQPGDDSGEGDGEGDQSGDGSKGGSKSSQQSGDQSDKGSKGGKSSQQPGDDSGEGDGEGDQSGDGSNGSQSGQQPGDSSGEGDGDGDQSGDGSSGGKSGQSGDDSGDGDGDGDQAGGSSKGGQSGQPGDDSGDGDGDGDQAGGSSNGSQSGQSSGDDSGDGDGDGDQAGDESGDGDGEGDQAGGSSNGSQSDDESDGDSAASNSSGPSTTDASDEDEYNEDDEGGDGMHVTHGEAPNTDTDEAHHGVGGYTETGDVSDTPSPVEDTSPTDYDLLSGLPEGDPGLDPMYQPVLDTGFEGTYYDDPSKGLNPIEYRDIIADARRQVANPLIAVLAEPPQAIIQRRSSSRGRYNALADLRSWGDKPQTFDMVSEGRGDTFDEFVIDASGSNHMREAAIRLALMGYYLAAQECGIDVAVTVTGNSWDEKSPRFPHYQVLVEHGDDPEKAMCYLRGFQAPFGTEWLYQGLTVRLERLKASRAPNRRLIVLTDAHLGVGGTKYTEGRAMVHGHSADKDYTTDWGNCYQILRQIPEDITVIPVLLREHSQVDAHETFCLGLVRQLFPSRYPLLSCTIGSLPRALADALLNANNQ